MSEGNKRAEGERGGETGRRRPVKKERGKETGQGGLKSDLAQQYNWGQTRND